MSQYYNPNEGPYQYYQRYGQYPPQGQSYQHVSTSNPYLSYPGSSAMMQHRSQDSNGSSSDSNYSAANTYPYTDATSPGAYSPTETYSYSQQYSQQYDHLTPGYGNHPQSVATSLQPVSPTHTSDQHLKSSSSSSSSSSSPSSKATPYLCLHRGCTRQFARTYDLDRHVKTHFPDAVGKLDCPQGAKGSFCKRVGERGFTRKDHRDEHLRKVHMIDLPKSPRGTRKL
ncbi:MAG: hypothetical protein L6R40_002349 [Gallowayella cf. fulva]|nr:MAG: hypothetical protein L6R40_002349 [Xanthomendoza cf. fulva]